ncbi:MAG TPA: MMPL family transporter, partial [Dehalococcoidia bacterium]|nr:MMPL family transporter [Dehalococcoidia bacterium]
AVLTVSLGVFAPNAEHALSGAMWEVDGSESLRAREIIDDQFGGMSSQSAVVVLHSDSAVATDAAFQAKIDATTAVLAAEGAFGPAAPPMLSEDGHTAVVQAGALVNPTEAVRAAERIKDDVSSISGDGFTASLSGVPAFWADFNETNREGMFKAELLTWPVTSVILVLAFGSLVAAGLPLILTAAGLLATMGILYGITQVTDLSIWTLNFAMMFALALGIDYALFIVTRFRNALHHTPNDTAGAIGVTMDSAGKAVLFSGLTVIVSLSAVLLVPVPAFRSMAAGMMLAVGFVLLAALTLLPAILGPAVNRLALPWHSAGEHRSDWWHRFAGRIQKAPLPAALGVLAVLVLLALPLIGLRTGMPSISVLGKDKGAREGYQAMAQAFGPGGPGPVQILVPPAVDASEVQQSLNKDSSVAMAMPAQPGTGGYNLITAFGTSDPSSEDAAHLISGLRGTMPAGVLVGGPVAENYDLDHALLGKAPLVMGTVLVLGLLLLIVALQGLLISLLGVVLNLLSVGAAFGVGVLAFQHGWAADVMGFESQGYLTSWAPLFFFTLTFAISMDYTVFLLASAREHFDHTGDHREALASALAHTGRPIVAAAGVMVTVFFTFALAGTLPMKEMGFILGVAVLADAFLVRLILVPALLALVGESAWWLPRWADRLLPDVRFGH